MLFYISHSLARSLLQIRPKLGLIRLFYIIYSLLSLLSGVLILLGYLISDWTGIFLFLLSRALLGYSQVSILNSEDLFIFSVLHRRDYEQIHQNLQFFYFSGIFIGSIFGLLSVLVSPFAIIIVFIIINIVHLSLALKTYPNLPSYYHLRLGSKTDNLYFDLTYEDYYEMARRDRLEMRLSEKSVAEASTCGLLIMAFSNFSGGISLTYLVSHEIAYFSQNSIFFEAIYFYSAFSVATFLILCGVSSIHKVSKASILNYIIAASITSVSV